MAWKTVYETDELVVRVDVQEQEVILETCQDGLVPTYVTVRMNGEKVRNLIASLQQAQEGMQGK